MPNKKPILAHESTASGKPEFRPAAMRRIAQREGGHKIVEGILHAALCDTKHRVCQHALASHLILLNQQARLASVIRATQSDPRSDPRPKSWPAPRPEAPPDVT